MIFGGMLALSSAENSPLLVSLSKAFSRSSSTSSSLLVVFSCFNDSSDDVDCVLCASGIPESVLGSMHFAVDR